MTEFIPTIGLETHIQLNTLTKAFCGCKADSWGAPPNTSICPVCTGQPGALPVPNAEMVRKALRLCLALNCEVNRESFFDRKNYLYADLPGGYQITQNDQPIGVEGWFDLEAETGESIRVRIDNIHIEEDAGKTKNEGDLRLIDYNRAGVPLVEVVTKPDLHSADEAALYLMRLRQLARWLGISEGNMEKAHIRSDVNVSLAPKGAPPGKKCEIKNINSIEAVRRAIRFEIARQTRELEAGRPVEQWTIEWDNDAQELRKMRSKEDAVDYRYFREPNLMPLRISEAELVAVRAAMPELPAARRNRFMTAYRLPAYDARILTQERDLADYFEETCSLYGGDPKQVSNWIMNEILRLMRETGTEAGELKVRPADLAAVIRMVDNGKINISTGKTLPGLVQDRGSDPETIVREQGLGLVRDDQALSAVCEKIIADHPDEVKSYRAGKETLMGWFIGQGMRAMRGKADPKLLEKTLREILGS